MAHPNDDWYVFTVLGNKAETGRSGIDRYTSAVTRSDEITRAAIEVLNLADFRRS